MKEQEIKEQEIKEQEFKATPPVKIKCPHCGSEDCFEESYPEMEGVPKGMKGYLCKSCGMTSSSAFTDGSKVLENGLSSMPKFIQDHKFFDEKRKIWWFFAVVQTQKGHVFPEANEKDWHWTFMPVVKITDEELENYPIPGQEGNFYESRLAEEQALKFHKSDFAEAIKMVGLQK